MADSNVEITLKGEAEVVRLQPGDVIIARFPERLPRDVRANTQRLMAKLFPRCHTIVDDSGSKLDIIRAVTPSDPAEIVREEWHRAVEKHGLQPGSPTEELVACILNRLAGISPDGTAHP